MKKKLRVLIADDNPLNLQLAKINIEKRLGHKVEIAKDGNEAIELFKNKEFDYILMDIEMPNRNGLEATKIIREIEKQSGKKSKIIALTAYGYEESYKYFEVGMDDYCCKPINLNKIKSVLV